MDSLNLSIEKWQIYVFIGPNGAEKTTTKLLEKNIINIEDHEADKTTYQNLLSIKGIGPSTASHVMVLLHNFSRIPIDSEVSNYMKTNYNLTVDQISDFYNPWEKYKFLGYKIR